jgi:hypothetical protein
MMRRRPFLLFLTSFALIAVAISLPVQIMLIYGHGLDELDEVFAKLTMFNWVVMIGCLACAVLIAEASPLCFKAIPALTVLVALNNLIVGYYAVDYAPWMTVAGSLAFALFNLPLFDAQVRELMKYPERRWWMRAERHRRNVPVVITGALRGRSPVRTETFDLSDSGLFLPLEGSHFEVDDRISVRMTFGTFSQIRCEGRVVRRAEGPRGEYPSGIGVQFTDMDWRQRRELRRQLESGH